MARAADGLGAGGEVLALRRWPGARAPGDRRDDAAVRVRLRRVADRRALVGGNVPAAVTLQIANALSSNVVVGSENLGKALALGDDKLVAGMAFTAWVQRRAQRWLQ